VVLGAVVWGAVVLGAVVWGAPLLRPHGGLEDVNRVLGEPGQRVTDARELRPQAGTGTAGLAVPAGGPADRAPLALWRLVPRRLGGGGLPDIGGAAATAIPAAKRGTDPVRHVPAQAARPGLHQPSLEVPYRVAARLTAHT
jgi:hypothetical protein